MGLIFIPGGVCGHAVRCRMCSSTAIRLCGAGAILPAGSGFRRSHRDPCIAVLCCQCSFLLRQAVLQAHSPLHIGVICFVIELRLCSDTLAGGGLTADFLFSTDGHVKRTLRHIRGQTEQHTIAAMQELHHACNM
jgi:hypothetical protein